MTLGLVRELVDRGHRVTYLSIPAFADEVAPTGADFVPYTSTLPVANGLPPRAANRLDMIEQFLTEQESLFPQLRSVFEKDRPDLLLCDRASDAVRILADDLGIPFLIFCTAVVPPQDQGERRTRQAAGVLDDPRGAELHQRLRAWLADNGQPDADPWFWLDEPERALALIPRCMQPASEAVNTNRYTFVGWCGDRPGPDDGWSRPDGVARVVFVSLGTVFTDRAGFYRDAIAAFADRRGWHLVLQIGRHVDEAALGPVQANVEVHRWVPQTSVLAACDVFVTHGGMGSSLEGIRSETPMIVVPQSLDQFSNARRLVDLAVARQLDTDRVTPRRLRATAKKLVGDRKVAGRLAEVSAQIRADGGPAYAADLVEKCLP
ncbi:macrolide-inactivating glycosyltransferase [Dactylosporangium darangshiense]|uniref:Macrolide-inactivating glycosyltransferase n=2 Tax=Dactylosporangium darangshiense TaxID=579108 RepID=A0ABP8DST8_9ACTN